MIQDKACYSVLADITMKYQNVCAKCGAKRMPYVTTKSEISSANFLRRGTEGTGSAKGV
jgi:predicted  nucleic acid-binding Zn-ribbon protein